ncbi:MAG: hypothetical protein KAK00_02625 [Nanoarchaeota archaeon]|nr:hypothetical protein [Nanoarchaeota archaeon]
MKNNLINQFTKSLIIDKPRKNKVTSQQITSTLIISALSGMYVKHIGS